MRATSYEGAMLAQLAMPSRQQVEQALLRALLRHGGVVKEFATGEAIVDELADECALSKLQRTAYLETTYRKQNRLKKSNLWHRLLFRAADALAKQSLIMRPTETARLTQERQWMLTERGFDQALALCNIPVREKEYLPTKSYEVQKIVKKLLTASIPANYNPFDTKKRRVSVNTEFVLRTRGFRQAVVEAYSQRCAVCGLKIHSPDLITWEVQAAHIVPNGLRGRDDVCNGIALCRLHHWAFDVGWFTLLDDYKVEVSPKINGLSAELAKIDKYEFLRSLVSKRKHIYLPSRREIYPHRNAITWHRQNVFHYER
jgi:HNH endonuclease